MAINLGWPDPVYAVPGAPRQVLQGLGVRKGDYLVLPNLSPLYWAEAAKMLGADCILIDHHPGNWQLDLDLLEEFLMNYSLLNERDELILKKDSRTVRAIIVPHLLGGLCDLDRLSFIARRFNIQVGEDITQALGSRWNGRAAGSWGALNYCSFDENPILPFGQSVRFSAQEARLLSADDPQPAGSPMHALANALGRQLIPRLTDIIQTFRETEAQYRQSLQNMGFRWLNNSSGCLSNGLSAAFTGQKEILRAELPIGRIMPPVNRQSPFQKYMYIRREDRSGDLYDQAVVLPIRFDKAIALELVEQLEKTDGAAGLTAGPTKDG